MRWWQCIGLGILQYKRIIYLVGCSTARCSNVCSIYTKIFNNKIYLSMSLHSLYLYVVHNWRVTKYRQTTTATTNKKKKKKKWQQTNYSIKVPNVNLLLFNRIECIAKPNRSKRELKMDTTAHLQWIGPGAWIFENPKKTECCNAHTKLSLISRNAYTICFG